MLNSIIEKNKLHSISRKSEVRKFRAVVQHFNLKTLCQMILIDLLTARLKFCQGFECSLQVDLYLMSCSSIKAHSLLQSLHVYYMSLDGYRWTLQPYLLCRGLQQWDANSSFSLLWGARCTGPQVFQSSLTLWSDLWRCTVLIICVTLLVCLWRHGPH